jgi:hypothetical protein
LMHVTMLHASYPQNLVAALIGGQLLLGKKGSSTILLSDCSKFLTCKYACMCVRARAHIFI